LSWSVSRFHEPPAISHARPLPEPVERAVWVFEPSAPALVLGSAQRVRDDLAPGIDVVRRRSGGGAVLVVPGEVLWVDVLLPAGDALWDDDVGRAFGWLGEVWAAALASLDVESSVHHGALVRSAWSDQVCVAGVGPGEVLNAAGQKVVGMAQRRTRTVARFQCAALGHWDPSSVSGLLRLPASAVADLEPAAAGVGVPLEDLLVAFLASLP
jgi:lipoate---protein ligase